MSEAEQVRREVMEFKQRLDGWGWVGTEVFEESPICYRVESCPMAHRTRQKVWVYWNVDGVTAQGQPPASVASVRMQDRIEEAPVTRRLRRR